MTRGNNGSLGFELQNSIVGGIFNPGRNVALDCPTGNCTFPNNYHTVGLCSSCIDTTNDSYIQPIVNDNITTGWTINLPASRTFGGKNLSAVINKAINTTVTTEGPDYLLMRTDEGKTDILIGRLPTNTSAPCTGSCPSLVDQNVENCNASRNHLRWGCDSPAEPGIGLAAARCSLFPCVKTYTAVVN